VARVLLRPQVAGDVFAILESLRTLGFRAVEWFLMRFEVAAKAGGLAIRTRKGGWGDSGGCNVLQQASFCKQFTALVARET
jgi:hypothetical protein